MIVTRLKKVPWSWVWLSQLPFVFWMITEVLQATMFALTLRKFVANPAIITTIIGASRLPILVLAPLVNYLSDHIWTRWGRRKPFYVLSNGFCALFLALMPLASNIVALTVLLWLYQMMVALGKTFFPLSQEVIPIAQRGRGAAIHQVMFQLGLVIYFGFVLGRFDDVYFLGPLFSLSGGVSGETFCYWLGALLMLLPMLIVSFGIKELPIPGMLDLGAASGRGRFSVTRFVGRFFRDVFDRQWSILYLLLVGATVFTISLGPVTAFLYTEQWGYSLQDMGTNIMLALLIMLPFIATSGWLADRFSKMAVYLTGMAMAVVLALTYYLFVRVVLPDQRPSLWQILFFGELIAICSQVIGTVSWPLVYEYVPRQKMGTANAGMELVWAVMNALLPALVGWWVAGYSSIFLPHAGASVHVSLREPASAEVIESAVRRSDTLGVLTGDVDVRTHVFPGRDTSGAHQWILTLEGTEGAPAQESLDRVLGERAALRERLEALALLDSESAASWLRGFEQIWQSGPTERPEIEARLRELDQEASRHQATVDRTVTGFRDAVASGLARLLIAPGAEVLEGQRMTCIDSRYPMIRPPIQQVVEAVARALRAAHPEIIRVGVEVEPGGLAVLSLVRVANSDSPSLPFELQAELRAIQAAPARLADLDAKRSWLGRLMNRLGLGADLSQAEVAVLAGQWEDSVRWSEVRVRDLPAARLVLALTNAIDARDAAQVGQALSLPQTRLVQVNARPGRAIEVIAAYLPGEGDRDAAPEVELGAAAVREQLHAVADEAVPLPTLLKLYRDTATAVRAVRTALDRGVIEARFSPQRYDYFSAYLLLMTLGSLSIVITLVVIRLERRGWIRRLGLLEEREPTAQHSP